MTTFDSFKLECENERKIKMREWEHGMTFGDCKYWYLFKDWNSFNQNFSPVLSRARMFSPSSWVKNVKEFSQRVIDCRLTENSHISNTLSQKIKRDNKFETKNYRDSKQYEQLMKVHICLTIKYFKLVTKAKKSQYRGLFSPQRLRKRIKLGNFSQILEKHCIAKHRAISPWLNLNRI